MSVFNGDKIVVVFGEGEGDNFVWDFVGSY